MQGPASSTEILVIGAGPAGCACALRLARLGHQVTLVERGGPGRPAVVESVPAAVQPWLATLGVQQVVNGAGFLRPTGAWVQWAGPAQRQQDPQPGFQLERSRFDALLRHAARTAGVHWYPAAARPAERTADGRWRVPLHDGRTLLADALVLATGRAGAPVPGALRSAALVGSWAATGLRGDTDSRVQAQPEAWAWAAPQADGGCTAALFLAASRLAGLDAAARLRLYRDELLRCDLLAPMLRGQGPLQLRIADATPRLAEPVIAAGLLRVGEAALSLDPLSSQGVVSALRSGVQGAACLHTMLRRPADAALALAFYQQQLQREQQRHGHWRAGFLAQAAGQFGSPFWQWQANDAARAYPPDESEPLGLRPPLPALEQRIQLDRRIRFHPAPMLDGDWVVAAPALLHPGLPAPVGYVQGQPVAGLLAALAPHNTVGRVLQAWSALLGAQAAVTLLQAWWRQGVVVEGGALSADGAAGSPKVDAASPTADTPSSTADAASPTADVASAGGPPRPANGKS
ncbi:flavin-dependent monooxygenase QhpG [Aquabacterium sp.]|uniref:flavin-dependent monooxygenase QhpG n=1 Tax=Aquabacterium sp. TaxID=1872578 RepID=UPI002C7A313F|nr:FAD-dependent oxidoreductase [Aquabacterium sp.]HSW07614.1 FAD-dependent oxidoreductase [Aquabacterium sp.]